MVFLLKENWEAITPPSIRDEQANSPQRNAVHAHARRIATKMPRN